MSLTKESICYLILKGGGIKKNHFRAFDSIICYNRSGLIQLFSFLYTREEKRKNIRGRLILLNNICISWRVGCVLNVSIQPLFRWSKI